MIALDGPTEEVYLLVSGGIDDEVHEPALDLGPLIAHLSRQPVRVLFECLMEDSDDNHTPAATRGAFGQLLKQMDIVPIVRCGFQKLAHFVDEHH